MKLPLISGGATDINSESSQPLRGTHTRGTLPSISLHIPDLGSIVQVPTVTSTATASATSDSPNAGGQTTDTNSKLLDPIAQISTDIQTLIAPSSSTSSGQETPTTDSLNTGGHATDTSNFKPSQSATQGSPGVQTTTPPATPSHLLLLLVSLTMVTDPPLVGGFRRRIQELLVLLRPLKLTVRVTKDPHPPSPFLALPLLPPPLARQDTALALHPNRLRTVLRIPTVTVQPRTRPLPRQISPRPASTSTGGTNATPNGAGPTDQHGPVSTAVTHPQAPRRTLNRDNSRTLMGLSV